MQPLNELFFSPLMIFSSKLTLHSPCLALFLSRIIMFGPGTCAYRVFSAAAQNAKEDILASLERLMLDVLRVGITESQQAQGVRFTRYIYLRIQLSSESILPDVRV